jgi:hypothetical protein
MKYITYNALKDWREKHCPKTCPIFECDMSDAVVDHCHDTGFIRNIIHRQSNAFIGKIENAWKRYGSNNCRLTLPQVLRRIAKYIENGTTDIMHPVGMKQKVSRFSRLSKSDQLHFFVKGLKVNKDKINACKNQNDRTKLYREELLKIYVNIN